MTGRTMPTTGLRRVAVGDQLQAGEVLVRLDTYSTQMLRGDVCDVLEPMTVYNNASAIEVLNRRAEKFGGWYAVNFAYANSTNMDEPI